MPLEAINSGSLVTTEWLESHLDSPWLKLLDITCHLPNAKRDARLEFQSGHIPGSIYFDLLGAADPSSQFSHTLPSPEHFSEFVGTHGIANDDALVLYDVNGIGSSPRAWWLFEMFGHKRVFILDGGLLKWKVENRRLESGSAKKFDSKKYICKSPLQRIVGLNEVKQVSKEIRLNYLDAPQIVDARSTGRFAGKDPEPIVGISSGHIPGSINLPSTQFWDVNSGTFASKERIVELLKSRNIDLDREVVSTCGSGVTACVLIYALHMLGSNQASLFEGSWAEWASDLDAEIDTD
jgi:thiosulfate/3-mercaptopyruvate sulfurtransferase